jgi:tetratricopeptide (TPR) repeat protein
LGGEHIYLTVALVTLGIERTHDNDDRRAEQCFEEALRIVRKRIGLRHPLVGRLVTPYGRLHQRKSDFAGAERLYLEFLSAHRRGDRLSGPLAADVATEYAIALRRHGRLSQAQERLKEALECYRRSKPPLPMVCRTGYAHCTAEVAAFCLRENRPHDAETVLLENWSDSESADVLDADWRAMRRVLLADALLRQGEYESVETLLTDALRLLPAPASQGIAIDSYPDGDSILALVMLGKFYRDRGRLADAFELARRRARYWPRDARQLFEAAAEMACCAADIDRAEYLDEALATLRRALDRGYCNVEELKTDPRLARARTRRAFGLLVSLCEKNRTGLLLFQLRVIGLQAAATQQSPFSSIVACSP